MGPWSHNVPNMTKTGVGLVRVFCPFLKRRALTVKMRGTPRGSAKDGDEREGDGSSGFGRAGARAADPDITMPSDPLWVANRLRWAKQWCICTLASDFRRALLVGLRRTHKFPSPMSDACEEVRRPERRRKRRRTAKDTNTDADACAAAAVTAAGASFRLWSLLPPLDEQQTQPGRKEGREEGK